MTWGEPSPGQVLIRVRTAGAGFPDVMMVAGHFPLPGEPPWALGKRAAGDAGEWTCLSPAPVTAPGERAGAYRLGGDNPVGEQISPRTTP